MPEFKVNIMHDHTIQRTYQRWTTTGGKFDGRIVSGSACPVVLSVARVIRRVEL